MHTLGPSTEMARIKTIPIETTVQQAAAIKEITIISVTIAENNTRNHKKF